MIDFLTTIDQDLWIYNRFVSLTVKLWIDGAQSQPIHIRVSTSKGNQLSGF